jgi:biopolymer transport protein ExbD
MAMTTGSTKGYSSEINMTPMIDILLVLLIVFMVITPAAPKGLSALVPQPPRQDAPPPPNDDRTVVVQVLRGSGAAPQYKINETGVAKADLLQKLTDIFANRAERVLFVKSDDDVDFSYVAEVIDIGYNANVDHIGLMTPKMMAGL